MKSLIFVTSFICLCRLVFSMQNLHRFGQAPSQGCRGKRSTILGGKEYKLFNKKANYRQAQTLCRRWGEKSGITTAQLASIMDFETQNCLTEMIRSPGNYKPAEWRGTTLFERGYIVGGSDHRGEALWKWDNGLSFPATQNGGYQNWAPHEPNNWRRYSGEDEDCISLLIHKIPRYPGYDVGKWVDHYCNLPLFYICEREVPVPQEAINWGFPNNNNSLTPEHWSESFKACSAERQSPVNIDISVRLFCEDDIATMSDSGSDFTDVKWIIENDGRDIKITFKPDYSLYTTFHGSATKHYIECLHLKFGANRNTGSEHAIHGRHYAGELQIFHHPIEEHDERHALSFMLQERLFRENKRWSTLLHRINHVQEARMKTEMNSPQGHLKHLLGEGKPNTYQDEEYITSAAMRYRGSLTEPPCTGNIIWTVFPRPISLSYAQFSLLRQTRIEGGAPMKGNVRPVQPHNNNNRNCLVIS